MQEVFGGSSGSSEAQSQYTSRAKSREKSKTVDVTPDAYKALRNPLAGALQNIMGGNGAGINKLISGMGGGGQESMVAPIGANEQQVLNQLMTETAAGNPRGRFFVCGMA